MRPLDSFDATTLEPSEDVYFSPEDALPAFVTRVPVFF